MRWITRSTFFAFALLGAHSVAQSQTGAAGMVAESSANPRVEAAAAKFKQKHPEALIEYSAQTGLPKSIKGLAIKPVQVHVVNPATMADVDGIVKKFFVGNQELFLQAGTRTGMRVTQKKLDPQIEGRAIATVQQTIRDIDVYGAEASVSVDLSAAAVEKLSGANFVEPPALNTTPDITAAQAIEFARLKYGEDLRRTQAAGDTESAIVGKEPTPTSKLVFLDPAIFRLAGTQKKLAWVVQIGTFRYFIDAHDKTLIHRFRDLPSSKNRITYDANGAATLPGTLILQEQGPQPPDATPSDDARAAHESAGLAYDFYFSNFHRDSYDNKPGGGSPLTSSVRYANLQNAYWDGTRSQMVYGAGYSGATDVVGHEITHGVINAEAKLQYFGESGAANEAFADYFGVLIAASKSNLLEWKVGETVPGFSSQNPLRNMADPHNNGFDPAKDYGDSNHGQPESCEEFVTDSMNICASTNDYYNGCVHINSGILDKAFYLATVGGSGAGAHATTTVVAIGATKMQQILYRTLTAGKVTSVALFSDVAKGAVEACADLAAAAKFGIVDADCANLKNAFLAVGVSPTVTQQCGLATSSASGAAPIAGSGAADGIH